MSEENWYSFAVSLSCIQNNSHIYQTNGSETIRYGGVRNMTEINISRLLHEISDNRAFICDGIFFATSCWA